MYFGISFNDKVLTHCYTDCVSKNILIVVRCNM